MPISRVFSSSRLAGAADVAALASRRQTPGLRIIGDPGDTGGGLGGGVFGGGLGGSGGGGGGGGGGGVVVAPPPPVPPPAAPPTVFVELGTQVQAADISREGVAVAPVEIDRTVLDSFLAGRLRIRNKVITQSIQPGVTVAKGTSVDLVFAQPDFIPIDVIQDHFQPLTGATIGAVFNDFVVNNDAVRSVIARNQSADTLSDADRGVITTAFAAAGHPVTTDAGSTMTQAFNTLQAAFTMGGGAA
jgi:hypothetical protein